MAVRKARKVNLYKWRLMTKTTGEPGNGTQVVGVPVGDQDIFVIDRADNKRRRTSELMALLLWLHGRPVSDVKFLTASGCDGFRGYAASYGCRI